MSLEMPKKSEIWFSRDLPTLSLTHKRRPKVSIVLNCMHDGQRINQKDPDEDIRSPRSDRINDPSASTI